MNKFLWIAAGVIVLALLLFGLFRQQIKEAAYDSITENMFVEEDSDSFDPGPAIGSRFPGLNATYRGDTITLIEPFAGPAGTLLMASRSFDWCPYCMKQMIELNRSAQAFADAGIGLVAITYDSPEQQQAFAERHGITVPILSDVDTLSFRTLGILNPDYQPGDTAYGIPYPGMIIIAPDGRVVGKLFLEGYSTRVSAAAALTYASQQLAQADAAP
jgi:peroxiredoxin